LFKTKFISNFFCCAAGNMSDKDKNEFEKRLNNYIKEIDRSISLLGE